ncbi:MAG: T9SS type A sorting domain-containing protein [Chitinophagales bacterium]
MKKIVPALLLLLSFQRMYSQNSNLSWIGFNDPNTYYLSTGKDYHIPFYLSDKGPSFSHQVTFSYSVNNGAPVKQTAIVDYNHAINCVNAMNLSNYRVSLNPPVHFNTPGDYYIKIWIDSIDGYPDTQHSNDTTSRHFKAIDHLADRKGLTEYYYHTYCGPCGEHGTKFFEWLIDKFDNYTVCVKEHNYTGGTAAQMSMNCDEAIEIDSVTGSIPHPEMTYNRIQLAPFQNTDYYYPYMDFCPFDSNFLIKDVVFNCKVPAELSASEVQLNNGTGNFSFRLNAKFLDDQTFLKEVRLSCMLVEDSIWEYQANDNTSPIDSIWHRFVLRKIYGGSWGAAGSVPASVTANQVVSLSFSDVLPSRFNKKQLYLIPVMQYKSSNYNGLEVLNVERLRVSDLLVNGISENQDEAVKLYPNPAASLLYLEMKTTQEVLCDVQLYEMNGRSVAVAYPLLKGNAYEINISALPTGIYFLKANTGKGFTYSKLFLKY